MDITEPVKRNTCAPAQYDSNYRCAAQYLDFLDH